AAIPFAAAESVEDGALLGLVEDGPGGEGVGVGLGAAEEGGFLGRGVGGKGRAGDRGGGEEAAAGRWHGCLLPYKLTPNEEMERVCRFPPGVRRRAVRRRSEGRSGSGGYHAGGADLALGVRGADASFDGSADSPVGESAGH